MWLINRGTNNKINFPLEISMGNLEQEISFTTQQCSFQVEQYQVPKSGNHLINFELKVS